MVEIYLPVTVLVIGVILPVNLQGDVVDSGSSSTGVVDEFTKFTMGNIENGSTLFLVHFVAVYLIIAWIVLCTHRMWAEYADLRIRYTKILSGTRKSKLEAQRAESALKARGGDRGLRGLRPEGSLDGTSKPGWYDSHATKRTERPAATPGQGAENAMSRSMFMGANETEHGAGPYFDHSLMRSFIGNGGSVKARTATSAYGRHLSPRSFMEAGPDSVGATERFPLSAGTPMPSVPERGLSPASEPGSDAYAASDDRGGARRHSRRETSSKVVGAEVFNDDIVLSRDDLLVDISQYAILVQDVVFSKLALFDDSLTTGARTAGGDESWVRRYMESWKPESPRRGRGRRRAAPVHPLASPGGEWAEEEGAETPTGTTPAPPVRPVNLISGARGRARSAIDED